MNEPDEMKGYEVTCFGITARVAARNRRQASYLTALSASDAGFGTMGNAFKSLRVRRAKWLDVTAICKGREGFIPEELTS